MKYFSMETLKFLEQLKQNNSREWFNENKQRFIDNVKNPFEIFIADLIEALQPYIENLSIAPKDAVFRIYRDVRFAKDKSPYKTNVSAIVSPGGRKDKTIPGVYIEFSAAEMRVYSGLYAPDAKQLKNLRSHISNNLDHFEKLITNTDFVKLFDEVRGEKNARIAKEFEDDAMKQPLLYNKQFYFFTSWPPETILENNIVEKVTKTFLVAQPLSEFLYEGTF